MSTLEDQPPVLPPIQSNEARTNPEGSPPGRSLSRSASLPGYSYPSQQPPAYYNRIGICEDFYTIPLHETTLARSTHEQSETVLIVCLLSMAFMAFCGALVICVLLSLSHGPEISAPIPILLFVMSAFLVISGGLLAKGVSLWLQKRARGSTCGSSELKEEKIYGFMKDSGGKDQINSPNRNITKQKQGK